MVATHRISLWVEVVPDHASWSPMRFGRVWKSRPPGHDGRLIQIGVTLPHNFLKIDDTFVSVQVPEDEAAHELFVGDATVES